MNQRGPFESPQEPFESPKELLNGAKERIAELETFVQSVSQTRDYEIITHTDPNSREKVVKLRLKHKFPPKIRSMASSILKELRLALDQAFCEAAQELGRKDAKGIYFPFGKDPENIEREIEKRCRGVDRRLIDYCLTFKPYYGGDSDGVLWSMSSLAGSTHQTSVGVGYQDAGSFGEAIAAAQIVGPLKIIITNGMTCITSLKLRGSNPEVAFISRTISHCASK